MDIKEAIEILKEYRTGSHEALKDIPKVYRAIDIVLDKLEITIAMKETAFEEGYRKGKIKGVDEGFHSGFSMGLKRGVDVTKEVEE